jgi:alpha-tubulin suppressor-like RCC1 family protein
VLAALVLYLPLASAIAKTTTAATAIAAGGGHTCVLTSGGGVDCWGNNDIGQLGDGSTTDSSTPVEVKGVGGSGTLAGVIAITAEGEDTCVLTSGGGVDCWGGNGEGQLGDGSTVSSSTPVEVEGVGGAGTLAGVKAITAGGKNTCALTSTGGVDCWGYNGKGQLGDGSTTGSSTPVEVEGVGGSGILSGVKAITTAGGDTCAVRSGGGVDCWGSNGTGELGDGKASPEQDESAVPVEVEGVGGAGTLAGVVAIAAGENQICALLSTGGVDCWGSNRYGQLGDGSTTNRHTPVEVEGVGGSGTLAGAIAISSEGEDACALTSGGGVDCWGYNRTFQLGHGSLAEYSDTPAEVKGVGGSGTLSGVVAIAVGIEYTNDEFACALTSTGGVDCWGDNDSGELGDGSTSTAFTPVEAEGVGGLGTLSGVIALAGVKAIVAGEEHACALTDGGGVGCWGGNGEGQLGDGSTASSPMPVEVKGVGGSGTLAGVKVIAAGGNQTCALTSGGGVDCWGENENGQLGDGGTSDSSTPVEVEGVGGSGTLAGVKAITAGGKDTCALTSGGGVDCWGGNASGQLGDGSTMSSSTPVEVEGVGGSGTLAGVIAITADAEDTCALTSVGGVDCWGGNGSGQLDDGSTVSSSTPVEVEGVGGSGTLAGVEAIAVGENQTCVLTSVGGVDCWGGNGSGQLGDGSTVSSSTPVEVEGVGGSGTLAGVVAITAQGEDTCALTSVGGVDCWGDNSKGQPGDGSTMSSSAPVAVNRVGGGSGTLAGVAAITAGADHTCALTSGGGVDCWGNNDIGQLGDGSTTDSSTPVEVVLVSGTTTTTTTTPTTGTTSTTTPTTGTTNTTSTTSTVASVTGSAEAGGQAIVKGGKAALKLHCTGSGSCKGTVELIALVSQKRIVKLHGKWLVVKRTRKVVIGASSFSLANGASETLDVQLSAKGKKVLRNASKKGLQVSVEGSDIAARAVILKVP